jgi:hypothetical protein
MALNVSVAAEGEEVWFEHPLGPANLFYRIIVRDGVLTIEGFHCAFGPAKLEVTPISSGIAVTMPDPPLKPQPWK